MHTIKRRETQTLLPSVTHEKPSVQDTSEEKEKERERWRETAIDRSKRERGREGERERGRERQPANMREIVERESYV